MLRRDYLIRGYEFDDCLPPFIRWGAGTHYSMLYVTPVEDGMHCDYWSIPGCRQRPSFVNRAKYLLIVNPSDEVRTLRDPDIGLDVLPADWHERSGEELFALGQPFAFGGEELPADGGRSSEGAAGAGVAAQAEAQPERAIADASESEDAVDTTVTAARREPADEPFIFVPGKYGDGGVLIESGFSVPNHDAIARKAARERVEWLRSVRDAIGWPFV